MNGRRNLGHSNNLKYNNNNEDKDSRNKHSPKLNDKVYSKNVNIDKISINALSSSF